MAQSSPRNPQGQGDPQAVPAADCVRSRTLVCDVKGMQLVASRIFARNRSGVWRRRRVDRKEMTSGRSVSVFFPRCPPCESVLVPAYRFIRVWPVSVAVSRHRRVRTETATHTSCTLRSITRARGHPDPEIRRRSGPSRGDKPGDRDRDRTAQGRA